MPPTRRARSSRVESFAGGPAWQELGTGWGVCACASGSPALESGSALGRPVLPRKRPGRGEGTCPVSPGCWAGPRASGRGSGAGVPAGPPSAGPGRAAGRGWAGARLPDGMAQIWASKWGGLLRLGWPLGLRVTRHDLWQFETQGAPSSPPPRLEGVDAPPPRARPPAVQVPAGSQLRGQSPDERTHRALHGRGMATGRGRTTHGDQGHVARLGPPGAAPSDRPQDQEGAPGASRPKASSPAALKGPDARPARPPDRLPVAAPLPSRLWRWPAPSAQGRVRRRGWAGGGVASAGPQRG